MTDLKELGGGGDPQIVCPESREIDNDCRQLYYRRALLPSNP